MRYFIKLAYNGANYFGWQRQPEQLSVQEVIESALSTILNTPTAVTGCGRTDTGVHASQYYLHFDHEKSSLPANFQFRLNKYLPPDIAILNIFPVPSGAHARYDAYFRSYTYHLNFNKDPFHLKTRYHFPAGNKLDLSAMQNAAALLLNFRAFYPFCKTGHDAKTMDCELHQSEWILNEDQTGLLFRISANRFLRGMVRLIVGMSLNVGLGKLSITEVQQALETQSRLQKSLSVPPDGLYLTEVRYPESVFTSIVHNI